MCRGGGLPGRRTDRTSGGLRHQHLYSQSVRRTSPKNRNPGSALVYGYSATTTYAYVLDPYAVVANPASWYQNKPINYLSQFTLEYTKVGPDYSML